MSWDLKGQSGRYFYRSVGIGDRVVKEQLLVRELDYLEESIQLVPTPQSLVGEGIAEPEFDGGPSAGVVLQAYLRDSPAQLQRLLEWARATPRATPPPVART